MTKNTQGIKKFLMDWAKEQNRDPKELFNNVLQNGGSEMGAIEKLMYLSDIDDFFDYFNNEINFVMYNCYGVKATPDGITQLQEHDMFKNLASIDERMSELYDQAKKDVMGDYPNEWASMDFDELDQLTMDYMQDLELEIATLDKVYITWTVIDIVMGELWYELDSKGVIEWA